MTVDILLWTSTSYLSVGKRGEAMTEGGGAKPIVYRQLNPDIQTKCYVDSMKSAP